MNALIQHARAIWDAAVRSVDAEALTRQALLAGDDVMKKVRAAPRLWVVGAGKAGAAMAAGVEEALADRLGSLAGWVNVPEGTARQLQRIHLHAARPLGANEPTPQGLQGANAILDILQSANPQDVAIGLLSGGGSALLPAPVEGVSLQDKLTITRLLHRCGASIDEMNCVRKHLSRVKGGRLAEAFRGALFVVLIISDVVGDPLDVIASGPTAADPTTFADALNILERYQILGQAPAAVIEHLQRGARGEVPETPKNLPNTIVNRVIGSNTLALTAAEQQARSLGYNVLNLGAFIEGETREVAIACAGMALSIRRDHRPVAPPACILLGGETTVTLSNHSGQGGRNQEFVLAFAHKLGPNRFHNLAVLSGGTDGEDGPTDAAGAIADQSLFQRLTPTRIADHLQRHDAYPLLDEANALIRTGLTQTNVMDVRVILIGAETPH